MKNAVPVTLRVARIAISIVVLALVTYAIVAGLMNVPRLARLFVKVQFFPAAVAFSLTTIAAWLLVTLIFGRVYCSTVCPLGTVQDICARIPRLFSRNPRWHYHYAPPLSLVRNICVGVMVLGVFLGITMITKLLDPFSIYNRFCLYVLEPATQRLIEALGYPPLKIAAASIFGVISSTVIILIVAAVAFRRGRTFCNTVCPVGTALGYVSRYAIFHIDINTDLCTQCRKCEHVCKASCIDLQSHVVDSSRCVNCFDCLPVCPNDAIHYTSTRHQLSIPMMQQLRNPLAGGAASMRKSDAATTLVTPDTDETISRPAQ